MCGCNKSTCNSCKTTKECILRYTGETIDCLGIEKNELMETVIQTLATYACEYQEAINLITPSRTVLATYFTSMPLELDITQAQGFPSLSGASFTIPNATVTEITPLSTTVVQAGNYIVQVEFVIDAGNNTPKWFGYELRKNGILIPHSTRTPRITGGTPADQIASYSVNAKIDGVLNGDIISLHISNVDHNPPASTFSISVFGGSMYTHQYA